jgi:ABC-type dipeptide/oligopeptide/nickel transport system ATPase component
LPIHQHDLAAVEQIGGRVIVMEHGRIVEQSARDAVFDARSCQFLCKGSLRRYLYTQSHSLFCSYL